MREPTIQVNREEVTEIPGGKRYVYDWSSGGQAGESTHFHIECSRIDSESSYTMEMDIAIERPDEPEPVRQRQVIFGQKGEIEGNIRHDRVFITKFLPDGTSAQQELPDVQVRLDLGQVAETPFATLLRKGPGYLMDLMKERR